ncbi:hypothetical protein NitYY0826_P26 (plasmid) [Nitratiruptor sp. YY08-26]|nr:hypothetical protein NitYY0813_P26 [Nitratiruptor sp. YY08-13]BCD67121.1 hypothetical protein NitYY0826_P26 [Nitratiruptor sp. YY08-26]
MGGYGKGAKIILYDAIFPNSRTAIIKKKIVTNKSVLFSKDKWILVDGIWYHKFFQNVLPPKNEEEAEFQ